MNKLEKMIGSLAPQWALRRQVAKQKLNLLSNTGYSHHGASKTKKSLQGWNYTGGSPEEDINLNLEVLRERSRDLYMGGATLATGALKTARTNVVGTGLRLKPSLDTDLLGLDDIQAADLKRTIEREFALWAESKDCDAMRMNNFYALQQLAFLSTLMSGDSFALLPVVKRKGVTYDLRIKLIEADRCCNPQSVTGVGDKDIKSGVEADEDGMVVAYWFTNRHPLSNSPKKIEYVRVEAVGKHSGRWNVIHLMEAERPEQRRGVPILAPVIEALKQLGRYTEAELMAAVISGMFTVFLESENPTNPLPGIEDEDEMSGDINYRLGNGAIVGLAPGEKANIANPGRPNVAFDGFVTSILRQVGSALEIPYELLVKHFTASYSASRAALLEAWKMFRMRRTWLSANFCQPIYEEWFTEAVAKGRIPAPGFFSDPLIRKAYTKAEWHGPSQGQIDPLKEVKAAEKRVENGFSTGERETAELTGGDYEMNIRQLAREKALRKEYGVETKIQGGEKQDVETDEILDDGEERSQE
ncbi:phage portal protein [Paenibacillus larvae]|uniref:Phage portal protein, lambda family n=1 Tax=Paenibacillus larvae subsp. larvae TaxID=147375 RepID=A0A6C0R1K6_9BACL|nr:phage portal protein [Paenibacillus larvae]QHZ54106.1 phage portal protein, lambda family [Paenibacillus phage phiERICV]ETK29817.1 phage portal protein, lambda family [Paenibacillus larvae subsp. larvae DSM 25719]MCY9710045.1 phage portal protein [Paenibacillus larvae]MCY9718953.1 phage portal protein [Paenibacillus larvae]QHZ50021.1 phage portal protein, lambda family [Paenibacillus larvae subsp. larvae]